MFVKIAGIQMSCSEDKDRNLKKAAEMAEYALENGAKIIAFQQLFHLPWFPEETDEARFFLAEEADGPAISRMREIAKKGGAVMVCPIFERDGENCYNTAFVIDADGSVAGKYRKAHVPDIPLWREKFYFTPGDQGFPVVQTRYAKIGVQLCWDVFFPEGARSLALKGAELIVAPTAAAFASALKWERMLTSAAIANGTYVFRVNRVGGPERQRFYGKSFLVNPFGEITIEPTGRSDAVVLAEMDTDEVAEAREVWNFMADRRPEHYGDLTEGRA